MNAQYKHLSSEERAIIKVSLQQGASLRSIAGLLSRSASTISREVSRNRAPAGGEAVPVSTYDATLAGVGYRARRQCSRRRRRLVDGTALHRFVHDRLVFHYWSPQQIAARLRRMYPDDPAWHVSHETIYAAIYAHPKGALKKDMIAALRQAKPTRGRRRTTRRKGHTVPEALRIVHRPEDIAGRHLPGHWEGDFIKGAYNRSAVGTLVERKTRFVVLCKMRGCDAPAAVDSFTRQMRRLPAFLRASLTYDRGSEMARHAELAKRLRLDIWFADPYAPWQRGSNENTNGLIRQFLPKGIDLSQASQTHLNDIARLLNSRPRETLDWRTPDEMLADEMNNFANRVALDS